MTPLMMGVMRRMCTCLALRCCLSLLFSYNPLMCPTPPPLPHTSAVRAANYYSQSPLDGRRTAPHTAGNKFLLSVTRHLLPLLPFVPQCRDAICDRPSVRNAAPHRTASLDAVKHPDKTRASPRAYSTRKAAGVLDEITYWPPALIPDVHRFEHFPALFFFPPAACTTHRWLWSSYRTGLSLTTSTEGLKGPRIVQGVGCSCVRC